MLKRLLFLIAFLPILASAQTDPKPSPDPPGKPVTDYQAVIAGDTVHVEFQNGKYFYKYSHAWDVAHFPQFSITPSTLNGGIFKNTAGGLFVPGTFYYDNTNSQYVFTQPILANALGYSTVAYRIGATSSGLFVRDTVSYALKYGTTATLPPYIKNYVDSLRALQPDLAGINNFTGQNTFSGGSPLTLTNAGLAINGNGSDGSQSINFSSNALYYNSAATSLSWNGHGIGVRTSGDYGFIATNTTAGYQITYNPGFIQYADPNGGYTNLKFATPDAFTAYNVYVPKGNGTLAFKGDTSGLNLSSVYQPLENQRLSTSNSPSFPHVFATGTAGNGYYDLVSQSSSPSSSSGHLKIYADSLNRLSWKNSTYRRTIRVAYPSDQTINTPYKFNPVLADSTNVATAVSYKNTRLGVNIYNKTYFSSTSDWTTTGFTPTIVNNEIQLTGGANNYSQYMTLTNVITADELLNISTDFIVTTKGNGFGIGKVAEVSGSSYAAIARVDFTANTLSLIYSNTGLVAASTSIPFTVSVNDICTLTWMQNGADVYAVFTDQTNGKKSVPISATASLAAGGAGLTQIGASYITVYNFGGTQNLINFKVTSNQVYHPTMLVLSDSKGIISAVAKGTAWSTSLRAYGTVDVFAGPGDRTADALLTQSYITSNFNLQGTIVYIELGCNDIRASVSSATWQANLNTLYTNLTAAGATVYFLTGIPEGSLDQSALNTYITSTFPSNYITSSTGFNTGTMLASDLIHPNYIGHPLIFSNIVSSGHVPMATNEVIPDQSTALPNYVANSDGSINVTQQGQQTTVAVNTASDYSWTGKHTFSPSVSSSSGAASGTTFGGTYTPNANNAVLKAMVFNPTFATGTGLLTVNISNAGSGYNPGTYTNVSPITPVGTGASVTVVVGAGGTISSVTPTTGGINYSTTSGSNAVTLPTGFDGGTASNFAGTVGSLGYTGVTKYDFVTANPFGIANTGTPTNKGTGMFYYTAPDLHFVNYSLTDFNITHPLGTNLGSAVPVSLGGTNTTSTPTQFSIVHAASTTAYGYIAPNTTATQKMLAMTGTGSAGQTASWVDPLVAVADAVNTATDANYTITSANQFVKLPVVTASRTVSIPTAASYTGRIIRIWNQNTSGTFSWSFTGATVKDPANNTLTTLVNTSVYILESDGSVWVKQN